MASLGADVDRQRCAVAEGGAVLAYVHDDLGRRATGAFAQFLRQCVGVLLGEARPQLHRGGVVAGAHHTSCQPVGPEQLSDEWQRSQSSPDADRFPRRGRLDVGDTGDPVRCGRGSRWWCGRACKPPVGSWTSRTTRYERGSVELGSTHRSQGLSQSSEGLYTRRVRGSVAHVVAEPEPPVRRCRRERRSSSRGGSELRSKSTSAPTSGIARSASAGPCGSCPVELAPPRVVRGCVGVPRPVRRSRGSVTD